MLVDFLRTHESQRTISPEEARANFALAHRAKWVLISTVLGAIIAGAASALFH
jgi:hypothetical protein